MTPFTVLATGPSGPVEEFEALRAAGLVNPAAIARWRARRGH
jgi:hypothetical protein